MTTDWRQFRKSTHLASADLDAMESEGKSLIFTIKKVRFESQTDVSGKKMDGIFCYFKENVKPWKVNSTNCKQLAIFAKNRGLPSQQANLIENWEGLTIELYVDRNVKMKGEITEGIRIRPIQPKINKQKPPFTEELFEKAKQNGATIEMIEKKYTLTSEIKAKYESFTKN